MVHSNGLHSIESFNLFLSFFYKKKIDIDVCVSLMLLMLLMFVVSVCRSLIGRRLCPEAATKKKKQTKNQKKKDENKLKKKKKWHLQSCQSKLGYTR